MKASTFSAVSLLRFRAWLLAAIVLSLVTTMAGAAPIYSTSGVATASNDCGNAVLCVLAGQGVANPERAANSSMMDFATMYKGLTVGSTVSLRLGLTNTTRAGQAGDRVGVLVAAGSGLLGLSAVGTYTIKTYRRGSSVVQESRVLSASVVQSLTLLSARSRPTQLEFVASTPFDDVELEITGVASLLYTLDVYYAYAVPSLVRPTVRGLVSRFAGSGTALAPYYSSSTNNVGIVSACAFAGVSNPQNAVDSNLDNKASFNSLASVSCPSSLAVRLEGAVSAPAGYYAGFVIGASGLLDLSALSGLTISTYQNGVLQETRTGAGILELRLLPDGKAQVSFPSTLPFNQVQITRSGALSALDNLDIYYGFGVEPTTFQPTVVVRSDYPIPAPATSYEVNGSNALCVSFGSGCTIINPQNAADSDLNNFASINTAAQLASVNELKLSLNGTATTANNGNVGVAGNRAGMVVSMGSGLLDAALLNRITLTTYDANGNLLESASGNSALSLNLLSSGRQELSFLTTQAFAKVQISVSAGVGLGANLNIYQAFADDRTGGIPSIIVPLPVELTAFTGKWAGGAAELNWATASEKNSSHFVVERSTGGEAEFLPVGQVAAAGSSSTPKTYRLRDAEAGTLGLKVLYYRLRQVDNDGKQAFSPVVSVAVGPTALAGTQLEVYPNPVANGQGLTMRYANLPATGATLLTYSQLGQLVSQQPVAEANARLALPVLTPGLYFMVLRDATGQQLATQRLVIEGR